MTNEDVAQLVKDVHSAVTGLERNLGSRLDRLTVQVDANTKSIKGNGEGLETRMARQEEQTKAGVKQRDWMWACAATVVTLIATIATVWLKG